MNIDLLYQEFSLTRCENRAVLPVPPFKNCSNSEISRSFFVFSLE